MGLDYLNKKVWHPGSMKNIQKVWDAQQAQLQVIKRQKERAKKLQDEQYNQEMKRIQVEAGLIPRSHLDRMDWMYDWGNKVQQQKNSEDYLTGAKKPDSKEYKHVFQQEATNKRCEDFVLLHEDPLYAIQKEEMKVRQSIMNNPTQMKNIIQEVEEDYLKKSKKQRKSSKKDKRDKKSKKNRKDRREIQEGNQSSLSYHQDKRRKHKQSHSESSPQSSSNSSSRSRNKSRNSQLYEDYLKSRFGNILKRNENGELIPDYSMNKKKYQTQSQLDQLQRQSKLDEMRRNAKKLKNQREKSLSLDREKGTSTRNFKRSD